MDRLKYILDTLFILLRSTWVKIRVTAWFRGKVRKRPVDSLPALGLDTGREQIDLNHPGYWKASDGP